MFTRNKRSGQQAEITITNVADRKFDFRSTRTTFNGGMKR